AVVPPPLTRGREEGCARPGIGGRTPRDGFGPQLRQPALPPRPRLRDRTRRTGWLDAQSPSVAVEPTGSGAAARTRRLANCQAAALSRQAFHCIRVAAPLHAGLVDRRGWRLCDNSDQSAASSRDAVTEKARMTN